VRPRCAPVEPGGLPAARGRLQVSYIGRSELGVHGLTAFTELGPTPEQTHVARDRILALLARGLVDLHQMQERATSLASSPYSAVSCSVGLCN
jgi:hypothetical protein